MSERILLLEDDKYIQDLIAMKFKLEHIDVQVAHSVEEALELISTQPWDLTIIDIMFPTRSGVDIAESILAQKLDIPFIFISAKNRAVFLEEFKDAVAKYPGLERAEYIMKPFDLDFLIKKIRETIVAHQAAAQEEGKKEK
jgi:DNA-binding response OmpR family regulator